MLVSRSIARRLDDRLGPRPVALAGFAVLGLATLPFAYADRRTPVRWLVLVLLVRGVGRGAATVPLMAIGFVGLARDEVPHASIVTRTMQVGGAAWVAVLAVVLTDAPATRPAVAAFQHSFAWAAGLTVVAVLLALLLPGRPSPSRRPLSWRRSAPAAGRAPGPAGPAGRSCRPRGRGRGPRRRG